MIQAFFNLIISIAILFFVILFIIGKLRGTPNERQANALEDIRNELRKRNKQDNERKEIK